GGLQALGIANDDTALGLGFDGEDPQLELVAVLPTQPGRIAPLSDHRLPDALGTGILDKSALLQAAVDLECQPADLGVVGEREAVDPLERLTGVIGKDLFDLR